MKKAAILGLVLLFALAVGFAPALAGSDVRKDCAKTCPVTSCPMQKKATADKADADSKDAEHACDYKGKCEFVIFNLEGMSGDDAEAKLTETLSGKKGVVKVYAIDSKAGTASFCYDPDIVKKDDLLKAVSDAGFKASVDEGSAKSCPHK